MLLRWLLTTMKGLLSHLAHFQLFTTFALPVTWRRLGAAAEGLGCAVRPSGWTGGGAQLCVSTTPPESSDLADICSDLIAADEELAAPQPMERSGAGSSGFAAVLGGGRAGTSAQAHPAFRI